MEIVLGLVAYLGALTGVMWAVARRSASAPLEPNPPREDAQRAQYSLGDQVLAAVAERHGLKHDVDVATGRVGGLRVDIVALPTGAQPERFTGIARFPRSLGLELDVRRRRFFRARRRLAVVSDEFDRDYEVRVLHADQARALFAGDLGRAFLDAVAGNFWVQLDDRELRVVAYARYGVTHATEAMSWLVRTAEAIVRARAQLPRPALEQQVLAAFETLAQAHGGRLDGDQLRLDLAEGELTVHLDRVGSRKFHTDLVLTFARPLSLDLGLGLEADRSRLERFRHRDIRLGDAAFDETFVVRGDSEEAVRAALDQATRERLLALARRVVTLSITSTEIEAAVDGALGDADALNDVVASLREVARALAPPRDRSAYR